MEDRYDETTGQSRAEGTGMATRMKEQANEKMQQVKDTAQEAKQKIDAQREPMARGLEGTAQRIRERGDRVSSATSEAVRTTADKIQATADYIREHDVTDMLDDVQDVVRRHPGPALAAAAVAGFLVGRALTRNGS